MEVGLRLCCFGAAGPRPAARFDHERGKDNRGTAPLLAAPRHDGGDHARASSDPPCRGVQNYPARARVLCQPLFLQPRRTGAPGRAGELPSHDPGLDGAGVLFQCGQSHSHPPGVGRGPACLCASDLSAHSRLELLPGTVFHAVHDSSGDCRAGFPGAPARAGPPQRAPENRWSQVSRNLMAWRQACRPLFTRCSGSLELLRTRGSDIPCRAWHHSRRSCSTPPHSMGRASSAACSAL